MIALTLKQLRYFEALARHRHFGRAADACAITQPALSLQIKELEAMLGAPLVERTSRQVQLTDLGERVLERAHRILVEVDELDHLVRAASGPLGGRLRLGVIPTVAPYLLPDVIRAIAEAFPELEVQPRESVTRTLIQDLLASRLDAAIAALSVSEPGLEEHPLFDEEFVLVRPASDKDLPVPSPASLRKMRLLLLEEGHCFRDQALSFCKLKQAEPRQLMEASSLSTLVQMVNAGMGVTLLPEMALRLETQKSNLAVARFPNPKPSRTIGMIWRKTNPLGAQLKEISEIVRTASE